MTEVIKASSPAAFLAVVPALLGFRPVESLVAVPFVGSRSIGAARWDLSEEITPALLADFLGRHAPDADYVVLAAFTEHRDLLAERVLNAIPDSFGWPLRGAFIVIGHTEEWMDLASTGIVRFPWSEVTKSPLWPLSAEAWTITQKAVPTPDLPASFGIEVAELIALGHEPFNLGITADNEVTPQQVASLVLACRRGKAARDLMVGEIVGLPDQPGHVLSMLVIGQLPWGMDIDPVVIAKGNEVALAAHSLYPTDPDVASIAAWSSWAFGRGSVAGAILDPLVEAHPEHAFLGLLTQFIGGGDLPIWAVARPQ